MAALTTYAVPFRPLAAQDPRSIEGFLPTPMVLRTNKSLVIRCDEKLVLGRATPYALRPPHPEELASTWNAFQHAGFAESGFNHVMLPFLYVSDVGEGCIEEAHAFSFLLSNALDWTPGCYCARHAYFVFKRARRDTFALTTKYEPTIISRLVQGWTATHAVGGTLRHGPRGYTGKLAVFSSGGRLVHEDEFGEPRDFFDLLGDVCVSAMRYFGYEPTEAMRKHLQKERCNHHQSIIDLGKAAFAKERSPEEFGLYRRILERDPGFAEVRYWFGNQSAWKYDTWDEYRTEIGRALSSYLTLSPLTDFKPSRCKDKAIAARYPEWIERATALVGHPSPDILELRLSPSQREEWNANLIDQAIQAARRYPNCRQLLSSLGKVMANAEYGLADCDMAASLMLASLASRYNAGSSASDLRLLARTAKAMLSAGHPRHAAYLLMAGVTAAHANEDSDALTYRAADLAEAFRQLGRHEDAIRMHLLAVEAWPRRCGWTSEQVARADLCAKLIGAEAVRALIKGEDFARYRGCGLVGALSHGMIDKDLTNIDESPSFTALPPSIARDYLLLAAQMDLDAGKALKRPNLLRFLEMYPLDRELWRFYDAYERNAPTDEAGLFYESLAWLFPNDPWIRNACKDFRIGGGTAPEITIADIRSALNPFKTARWPTLALPMEIGKTDSDEPLFPYGTVALAVRKLLAVRQWKEAKDLVLKYQHYATVSTERWKPKMFRRPDCRPESSFALRAYCNHLYHRIEEAQALPAPDMRTHTE